MAENPACIIQLASPPFFSSDDGVAGQPTTNPHQIPQTLFGTRLSIQAGNDKGQRRILYETPLPRRGVVSSRR
jgi:hypothetical protein